MLRPICWAIAFLVLQICGRGLLDIGTHCFDQMPWWKDAVVVATGGLCMWVAMRIEKNNG